MTPSFKLLVVGPVPLGLDGCGWGRFAVESADSLEAAAAHLAAHATDAVLLTLPDRRAAEQVVGWSALAHAVHDAAVVVVTDQPDAALADVLMAHGVQDLLSSAEAASALIARTLQLAHRRQMLVQTARLAYATDLATGLPNQTQLLEHMNHLLALREREPAPMALLVVHVEGLAAAQAKLGEAAAGTLRRKLAVRLRASLRASDVVASLGTDAFAALLAWIDVPEAGERVATKLTQALTRPLALGGREASLAVSVGVAQYPAHGKDAKSLLHEAFARATGQPVAGRPTFGGFVGRHEAAANDEPPPG